MHYLVAEKNKDVKYFEDRHELGLFEVDKTLEIMKKASFWAKFIKSNLMKRKKIGSRTKFLKGGRGLFVGIKK